MFWCRCTKCGRVVQGKYEDRGTGKQVWYDTEHECKAAEQEADDDAR